MKCSAGYIKSDGLHGVRCVSLEKAPVFGGDKLEEAAVLAGRAKECGLAGIKLVELIITEKEVGAGEGGPGKKLLEMLGIPG